MPWQDATQLMLDDLRAVHPDLPERLQQVDIVRHGHAMAIPTPGLRSSAALAASPGPDRRLSFAHADLSAYSVFEEAFTAATPPAAAPRANYAGTERCNCWRCTRAGLKASTSASIRRCARCELSAPKLHT